MKKLGILTGEQFAVVRLVDGRELQIAVSIEVEPWLSIARSFLKYIKERIEDEEYETEEVEMLIKLLSEVRTRIQ